VKILRADDRGSTRIGWLESFHSFSFGEYHDPRRMGFRTLRVLNDDIIAPGAGFGMHPHRDMEILTWLLSGELAHRDSLGHGATLRPGMAQRMTAGRGIRHSESNPSSTTPVHLLQVWILPRERGLSPTYEDRLFPEEGRRGRWQTIASPDGVDGSLVIAQQAWMRVADLDLGDSLELSIPNGTGVWLQVARGAVRVGDEDLASGDALAMDSEEFLPGAKSHAPPSDERRLPLTAREASQVLAFTLV
jgi:redox-sensitive bicupin YhaK (pirin superfamily)